MACPIDATHTSAMCSQYVYFTTGASVNWPITVPAMSSQIVVWTASLFKDTDRDGIVDSKDTCSGTSADTPVAENGCSFIQQYPRDLLPTAMSASRSGTTKVLVADTVKNQGSQSAGKFTIRYYLSTNTTYESGTDKALASSSNGTGVCERTVNALNAGKSSSVSNKTCYKPTGAVNGVNYYVLVVDDAQNQVVEYNESNNVRATAGTIRW
jgi:hypothetical protein